MAGLAAVMMGTFVFTTGSVWPEALGFGLLVLALLSFVKRSAREFRMMCFTILMILPLVHHLVAAVALITFSFLVLWSWYFAAMKTKLKSRNLIDLETVLVPALWAVIYYSYVSLDRLSVFGSALGIALMVSSFALMGLISIVVLSMKSHVKYTFGPLVGVGFATLLVLDYSGYVNPYTPSAPETAYLLLVVCASFLVSLAWYGSELIVEHMQVYRAVQIGLLVSPLMIIGYGLARGASALSQQILYRTFDFLDIFIFLGIGAAIFGLRARRAGLYTVLSLLVILTLAISFPFGYASEQLLGVRHDSQGYEIDALGWTRGHNNNTHLLADERLSHMGSSLYGFPKDASLPDHLKHGVQISSTWICLAEKSWTSAGVNDYPAGLVVIPWSNFTMTLDAANVLYLGGSLRDQAVVFTGSEVGQQSAFP